MKDLRPIFLGLSLILSIGDSAFSQDSLAKVQDTLLFRGVLSSWINFNPDHAFPLWLGARYIPQSNYKLFFPNNTLIDFEGSINLSAQAGFDFWDSTTADAAVSPYRLWARYSTNQFEARLGLQKINFGSATMLRPMMWFDQIDPRDPLQLTNGVYGFLGRYYFLNNRNIWLWALYGNKQAKTWEIGKTNSSYPELGGRFQSPVKKGEAGLSYHFRMADAREVGSLYSEVPEHRIGLDGKWDLGIGLWFEASWIHKGRKVGAFTNQELITVGTDYTFGIGKGINLLFEQFLFSLDERPLEFSNYLTMSALSISYPISMFDNLSALFYFDWANNKMYNFLNWKRQFKKFYLYTMLYWNPENSMLPQQQSNFNLFSGRGIQFMLVYNH